MRWKEKGSDGFRVYNIKGLGLDESYELVL